MSDETSIDLYWRPGCGFCMALDRGLAAHDLVVRRINIWEEPEAAAFVRAHAGGNETVPTVDVAGTVLVNPTAREVLATVWELAPELLPDDFELPPEGRVSRFVNRIVGG